MPLFSFWRVQIGTYIIQISLNSRLHTLWSVNDVTARDPWETRRGLKAQLVLFPTLSTSLRNSKDSLGLEISPIWSFSRKPTKVGSQLVSSGYPVAQSLTDHSVLLGAKQTTILG